MSDIAFFLHIPRTAGTTLNTILRANFPPEAVINVYDKEEYAAHAAHSRDELEKVRLIQGHLLLQNYDPPQMYGEPVRVFTFLREPLPRLVSEYAFLRTWKANHLYAYLNDNNVSFRDYLLGETRELRYRGKNFMTRCVAGIDTGTKAYPVKAVAKAKRHLERVFGFVGIQERFMESLLLLGDFLGIDNLLHEKRNALSDAAKPVVSAEDMELARELNRGDLELYTFAS
ncbi:sulfotransferase family 2 domain-containing protein, partial [Desulfovibrio sp. OttesenSCG-928-I05]|nr:sulfotransferase family 2 domain-containing protein [Desulfovibrio sp. OttesenSCG-928-I05]